MSTDSNFRTLVQAKFEQAGAALKPFEENTRRFFETATERVKISSTDGLRKVEELRTQLGISELGARIEAALQQPFDLSTLAERIPASEVSERAQHFVNAAIEKLALVTRDEVEALREENKALKKKITSIERKLTSRVLKKELNAVVRRIDKLEA